MFLLILIVVVLFILFVYAIYYLRKIMKHEDYTILEGPNNMLLTDDSGNFSSIQFPDGMILVWTGIVSSIPKGWTLCNGDNGTPDLRGRFVVGINPASNKSTDTTLSTYNIGDATQKGGSESTSVVLTTQTMAPHTHGGLYNGDRDSRTCSYGEGRCMCGNFSNDRGTDGGVSLNSTPQPFVVTNKVPPYYAVCYIMKINQTNLLGSSNIVMVDESNTMSCFNFPDGMTMLWNGSLTNIPKGWSLCNGENKTPDLRGRFLLGANPTFNKSTDTTLSTYNIGDATQKGGSETVSKSLTIDNLPSHNHGGLINLDRDRTCNCSGGSCECGVGGGAGYTRSTDTGTGLESKPVIVSTVPPYYTLCYIIKNTSNSSTITNLPGPTFDNLVLCDKLGNFSSIQFPKGMICLYKGDYLKTPEGWTFCDGKNGSPDLRGRFIVNFNPSGATKNEPFSVYQMNSKGGSETCSVTLDKNQLPPHTHKGVFDALNRSCECGGGPGYCGNSPQWDKNSYPEGGGQPIIFNILPPYYALTYIMKL